ncbi:MAG TPA: acyl-CoA dehydrogenase family protein [Ramlibacter sp.]|nr:acyl-CoA dehydrogenase family protein [Ramlibacter sp.]
MRFDLDDQQREFQRSVDEFLAAECPLQRALQPHDTGAPDIKLWRGLMELGIGGMLVPESHDGLGLGLLDLAVVAESVGRHAAPGPFLDHALATLAVVLAGTLEQKERWLRSLARGTARATVALGEGGGHWMAETWTIEAGSTLTGEKRFVPHAEDADLIVVGCQGGKLAVVARGAPGLKITPVPSTDAGRPLATVSFAQTPCTVLGEAAGARLVDAGLVLLAADAYGGASRCVDMSVEYSKLREQFGRPIGAFQAVKHQLADMALAVEPQVGLYWYAAHAFDADPAAAPAAAAIAKASLTETYPRIARRAIEAHGGIGYTWEFGVHVWLKRALFDQAFLGMPQLHRARMAHLSGW